MSHCSIVGCNHSTRQHALGAGILPQARSRDAPDLFLAELFFGTLFFGNPMGTLEAVSEGALFG